MNEIQLSPHARKVLLGDRQCTAKNRKGERCGRASALGQFQCDQHGGKAPLSIAAGRERMAALVEPAMDVLFRATRNAPPCELCGRSDADRDPTAVRAAGMILDRCGYNAKLTVEHEQAPAIPAWTQYLTDDQIAQISVWVKEARQRMFDSTRVDDALCIEGEVAESDPEPEASPTGLETSETGRDE